MKKKDITFVFFTELDQFVKTIMQLSTGLAFIIKTHLSLHRLAVDEENIGQLEKLNKAFLSQGLIDSPLEKKDF